MQNHTVKRRLLETAAMMVIGDSMLSVVAPKQHVELWNSGPSLWKRACEPFVRHPNLTRALGIAGIGFGFWLARRQERSAAAKPISRTRQRLREHLAANN